MMIQFHLDMMNLPGGPAPAELYREALDMLEYLW